MLAVSACSETAGPAACSRSLAVSVAEGSALVVSWTPAECGVVDLSISEAGTAIEWLVQSSTGQNTLLPPVTYGQNPGAGFSATPPETLLPGTTYRVRLSRSTADGGEALAGEATFTVSRAWP